MDKLFNAGKEFLQEQSNNDNRNESGNNNKPQGGAGGLLSSFGVDSSFLNNATSEASKRAGSSGDADMFSSIVSAIGGKEHKLAQEDIDEEDAVKNHKQEYKEGGNKEADENSMGTAAAVQALKLWNQGEAGDKQDKGSFLGLAMSEASKLFDAKAANGDVKSGTDKQSVIQQAGEVAMKLFLKSQGQQSGGLAGLAAKFL
ncbi:hypothetical protein NLU13_1484 [Sarocladium strictum]|uniref:DUF7721 domain-containing protein n=1 Tax=Sarocladium strictum TaxID=5046 RepID=A0AA39GRB8_SARSR|nr:hypothetical protein NLU13_1484 [Sarocladium strictum]